MTNISYVDFHLEVGHLQEDGYPVVLHSAPTGSLRKTIQFPIDDLAVRVILEELPRHESQPESLKTFGTILFDALFEGTLRGQYRVSRLEARRNGKGLRLRLSLLAPELAALPWEYLYDPDQGEYLALSNGVSLVRFIELGRPVTPLNVTPPLQVLGVLGGGVGILPGVQEEIRRIETATKVLQDKGLMKFTWLEGTTWRELQRALRRQPWNILHFAGHGGFVAEMDEGILLFADDRGNPARLRSSELGRLLANHHSLRLVFLNAGKTAIGNGLDVFSGTAATIVRRGVPAVIGMQIPTHDMIAVEMASTFYEALADGYPVDTALSEARIAVSLSNPDSSEWGAPVLYMGAPDGVLFVGNSEETKRDQPQINSKSTDTSPMRTPTRLTQRTPQIPEHPVIILMLAANPFTTTRLRLDEEVRAIDQALRQANYRAQFDLRQHWAVRASDLQELLLRHQPHIVHFSGHGSDGGQLIFEDDSGNAHPVQTDALSRLFAILTDNLRCVVLNACYSEPQAQAIAAHIDCVIGMPAEIGDQASLNFAASFYQALAYGRDAQTAFDLGCNQIDLQALDEPNRPKLLAQRANPREVIFVSLTRTPVAPPASAPSRLSPSQRLHLETQQSELQKRHATLTRRIDALETDIGRELDSERRLVLNERRHDLASEREEVIVSLADVERQLGLG